MTFRQLINEKMEQGWRAYHIDDMGSLTLGNTLHALAIRKLIHVEVYEGRKIVLVKDIKPPKDE